MLVNAKEILTKAMKNGYAVCQFNINNLEWTKFILEECEKNKAPVILGVSCGASRYMGGFNTVYNMVTGLLKDLNITIPVVLHLDHGSDFETCKKAIDAGFTSVMIDASKYDLKTNIEITKKVTDYAKKHNVTVEAEIGQIGGEEDTVEGKILFAKTEDSVKLVNETNIDFLAPALGSVHGLYKGKPNLQFDRMLEIKNKTNIPLVLHGASGLSEKDIKRALSCGISKININTDLQIAWSKQVREFLSNNEDVYDPRKIIKAGEEAFKKTIVEKLILTNSINKI
ncbi:MAG: class II fructose-1,6-bisphosphate aldolase [Mollicutes bacterium]|nr:class II fructose-1,6-bisphosphate aldolase [Mollicutes bacterium]